MKELKRPSTVETLVGKSRPSEPRVRPKQSVPGTCPISRSRLSRGKGIRTLICLRLVSAVGGRIVLSTALKNGSSNQSAGAETFGCAGGGGANGARFAARDFLRGAFFSIFLSMEPATQTCGALRGASKHAGWRENCDRAV